jgi:D-cysteine desulfhydrase
MELSYPPSLNFTRRNTPIILSKDLNERFKEYNIWLKRDDLTGMELSGNKVRKLDYLLQDALNQGANHIITCGGIQSNHCRATAYMAKKLGLECTLFLRGVPPKVSTGNYFLDQLVEPDIIFVTPAEYQHIETSMIEYQCKLEQEGRNAYIIPEGGSNEIGAWGYINCFHEILIQIEQDSLPIQSIIVATGSGGTHAGLLLGALITRSAIEISSVNVCDNADFFSKKIFRIVQDFKKSFGYQFTLSLEDIHIYDGFVGGGYGKTTTEELNLIKRVAQADGIVLDPVYTVKAYLGLEDLVAHNQLNLKNILFIHTGGIFSLFSYSNEF